MQIVGGFADIPEPGSAIIGVSRAASLGTPTMTTTTTMTIPTTSALIAICLGTRSAIATRSRIDAALDMIDEQESARSVEQAHSEMAAAVPAWHDVRDPRTGDAWMEVAIVESTGAWWALRRDGVAIDVERHATADEARDSLAREYGRVQIDASHAVPSDCLDAEGALDVDVTVTLVDGTVIDGGVTMVPDRINGGYTACGDSADCWVDSPMLRRLQDAIPDRSELREILMEIQGEAAAVCEARQ